MYCGCAGPGRRGSVSAGGGGPSGGGRRTRLGLRDGGRRMLPKRRVTVCDRTAGGSIQRIIGRLGPSVGDLKDEKWCEGGGYRAAVDFFFRLARAGPGSQASNLIVGGWRLRRCANMCVYDSVRWGMHVL